MKRQKGIHSRRHPIKANRLKAAIAAASVLVLLRLLFGVSALDGRSMEPTIHNGSTVVYSRLTGRVARDSVVVVKLTSGETLIKRVIALGGDTVSLSRDRLLVNGEDCGLAGSNIRTELPLTLKENQLFIIGDNREESIDSRSFGPVSESQLKGTVLFH